MLPSTLLLVLASAFLHALWNALLKRTRNLEAASVGIQGVTLLLTTACWIGAWDGNLSGRKAVAWGVAAGLCEGAYFLALVGALSRASLGWSYTWMRGGAVVLVWPLSMLFLGEALALRGSLCVGAVTAGLTCMGGGRGQDQRPGAFLWALGTGACIACYTLCYKQSLLLGARPVALFAVATAVSLPTQVGARILRRGVREALSLPAQPALVLLAGGLCAASFLLYLEALARQGAGCVATLRNTSVVFALGLSALMGERPPFRQWLGAALVAAGAAGLTV